MTRQEEDILVFASRYCLEREIGIVADYLIKNWAKLEEHTQKQIQREIRIAFRIESSRESCYKKDWDKILKL